MKASFILLCTVQSRKSVRNKVEKSEINILIVNNYWLGPKRAWMRVGISSWGEASDKGLIGFFGTCGRVSTERLKAAIRHATPQTSTRVTVFKKPSSSPIHIMLITSSISPQVTREKPMPSDALHAETFLCCGNFAASSLLAHTSEIIACGIKKIKRKQDKSSEQMDSEASNNAKIIKDAQL